VDDKDGKTTKKLTYDIEKEGDKNDRNSNKKEAGTGEESTTAAETQTKTERPGPQRPDSVHCGPIGMDRTQKALGNMPGIGCSRPGAEPVAEPSDGRDDASLAAAIEPGEGTCASLPPAEVSGQAATDQNACGEYAGQAGEPSAENPERSHLKERILPVEEQNQRRRIEYVRGKTTFGEGPQAGSGDNARSLQPDNRGRSGPAARDIPQDLLQMGEAGLEGVAAGFGRPTSGKTGGDGGSGEGSHAEEDSGNGKRTGNRQSESGGPENFPRLGAGTGQGEE